MWRASHLLPARCEKPPPGMTKGPAGRIRRALLYRQHRRQGSAGAWERRRGVAPLVWNEEGGRRTWGCRPKGDLRSFGCFLRIVLDERGPRNRLTQPLCIFAFSAGRSRASPRPTVLLVTGLLSPAVRSLSERGPTTHVTIRTSHRPSEPRVVLPDPPLAGADTGTNDAAGAAVTRRTGETAAELTPDVTRDPGTVRGASSPEPCRAVPARPGSGRGPPARGRGSPAGRRR